MKRNSRLFIPVSNEEKNMMVSLTEESGLTIASHVRKMIRDEYRMRVRAAMKEQLVSK